MTMEKEKLVSLVTKAQQGDATATNELFNAFYNDLYYFALKTIKDDDLALDVTQEAFVEIISTIGNLKEPAAFVTWAKQITYHQCTRYFKKKKDVLVDEDEEGHTVFDDLKEESAEFIPDEALDQSDFKKTILSLLDELSEEQRSAVMMYYFDEMSVRQIAEIQGVSEGTIKSRLNYARKTIKASVEEYEKKNNIKLHAIPFFPFIKWIFGSSSGMPSASATMVAEGVSAATGTTVTVASATTTTVAATTATTATAVGLGAKIAAIPLATKIIAGVVAAAITIGGTTTAIILSNDSDEKRPTDTQSIVSSEIEDSSQTDTEDETVDELVLEGIIPEGCTYTLTDGTVLTAGQSFPQNCTAGDVVAYGDYLYGYECIYMGHEESEEKDWHLWKDVFDSGDSGLVESDAFGAWSVMVADRSKTFYGTVVSKINGKPIKTLYATYYGCTNMTEAPKIPSTIKAMTASYYGCASLETSPVIPKGVERIMVTFRDCTSLTGDVEINATLDKSLKWFYGDAFSGTKGEINLTGSTPEDDLILIAKASDNRNITVNGKKVNFDEIVDDDSDESHESTQKFIVPEGCTYTAYSTGKVYAAGEVIEQVEQGDMLDDGEYVYGYYTCYVYNPTTKVFEKDELFSNHSRWQPVVIDITKSSYAPVRNEINGEPITGLIATYRNCSNMTIAPEIPTTGVSLLHTFENCTSLKEFPTLHDGIGMINAAFMNCTGLTRFDQEIPNSVTNLINAFNGCINLVKGPNVIPENVLFATNTFAGCENLENTPVIKSEVLEDMRCMFSSCKKITSAPTIPKNVTSLLSTFVGCESLKTAPIIHEKVTEMESTFSGCLSLTGEIIINAKNIEKYDGCFDWTELPITLKGSSPYLAELAATSNNGNVTVD